MIELPRTRHSLANTCRLALPGRGLALTNSRTRAYLRDVAPVLRDVPAVADRPGHYRSQRRPPSQHRERTPPRRWVRHARQLLDHLVREPRARQLARR